MSGLRVLVFAPNQLQTPHTETDLEIALEHWKNGDRVFMATCDAGLAACSWNVDHLPSICVRCMGRARSARTLLPEDISLLAVPHPSVDHRGLAGLQTRFRSLDELEAYCFEGYDVGAEALSTMTSLYRNPRPDLVAHAGRIHALVHAGVVAYLSLRRHLEELGIQRVYCFNGRFTPMRAAQLLGIECYTHDRGADVKRYALHRNTFPHDVDYQKSWIEQTWAAEPDAHRRQELADAFYAERVAGELQNWPPFVRGQQPGRLPEDWTRDGENITVFTSSDDELEYVGPKFRNPFYSNQLEAVRRIVADYRASRRDGSKMYVRLHPNQAGMKDGSVEALRRLEAPGICVLAPDSTVSTYSLLRECTRVLTFGSTVGIEAVYFGKPSILGGRALYEDLGGVYRPSGHQALVDLLLQPGLPALPRDGAIKFGYFSKTFGTPYRWFKAEGCFDGWFLGQKVWPAPFHSMAGRILGRLRRVDRRLGADAQVVRLGVSLPAGRARSG